MNIIFKLRKHINLRARILRYKVFVKEQNIRFKDEFCFDDKYFKHLYMYINNELIGYLRFKIEDNYIHIGRVIIKRKYRSNGYGLKLINYMDDIARSLNINNLYLNAQDSVIEFYKKCGYKVEGNGFLDASIPHHKMIKIL